MRKSGFLMLKALKSAPHPNNRQLILGGKPSSQSWHTIVCHGRLYFATQIHLGHTPPVRKRFRRLHHPPTTRNDPTPPGYCPHFNSCRNCSRTCKDTSNQARALPHTSQNTHRSSINISKAITAPPPSTVNAKQSITIRLLPILQLSRKLLENL
jgi:hypothetical protein